MRILEKGDLSEHTVYLGDVFFPAYYIVGEQTALVDAGIILSGPGIVRAFRERFGGDATIHWNLITHSHFDHLGSTPFLKRVFPGMKTAGSPIIEDILSNPRAVDTIRSLSGDTGDLTDQETGLRLSFDRFELDRPLAGDDRLDLGRGVGVVVIETPGHTRCSLAYFVEPDRVLFMGEASGVPNAEGYIQSEFLSDFPAYLASLEKMAALSPRFICLPHGGILTEEDADGYFERSAEAARAFRSRIERHLDREDGDTDRAADRIKAEEYDSGKILQDETAYMVNLRAMVRAVQKLV
jgi:glyoxylase-like metal-dependent hydrolase (beta-lactamase superfamily II)